MILSVLEKMINFFDGDVRRINHALKVFSFSKIISKDQNLDKDTDKIINYSAILHDVGIKEAELKYDSAVGNYQEIEGPPIVRKILSEFGISEEIISRVCFIIANHHSYDKIDGIDFQIIVEADFLVNIYENEMEKEAIQNVCGHIFKTNTGQKLLKSMYLTEIQSRKLR